MGWWDNIILGKSYCGSPLPLSLFPNLGHRPRALVPKLPRYPSAFPWGKVPRYEADEGNLYNKSKREKVQALLLMNCRFATWIDYVMNCTFGALYASQTTSLFSYCVIVYYILRIAVYLRLIFSARNFCFVCRRDPACGALRVRQAQDDPSGDGLIFLGRSKPLPYDLPIFI